MTTPEHAFQILAGVFSSRGNRVLEIEIIPPALGSHFLEDGASIGITKKALVQAYTVARHLFISHLLPMDEDQLLASLKAGIKPNEPSGLTITAIMLLFDCEHLTACNWRKRCLRAPIRRCSNAADQVPSTIQMLETELTLLTTYQCSPLHRHTKSPTLWYHRSWVLRQLGLLRRLNIEALFDLQRKELSGILRAAELHPKNYYAFSYMRQLHSFLAESAADLQNGPDWADELAKPLVCPILDWCLANPRDISGWMFAKYLLHHIPDSQVKVSAVSRALRFARDVGWEGESLWTFIDQTLREYDLRSALDGVLALGQGPQTSDVLSDPTAKIQRWQSQLAGAKAYWAMYGRTWIEN